LTLAWAEQQPCQSQADLLLIALWLGYAFFFFCCFYKENHRKIVPKIPENAPNIEYSVPISL